ncbi:helix-turn-helix domain-containing protein [Shewanella violacea]|uniref:OmpR/PhoB-type domain-containing protein n=1 Tax=Shewanella violacea (strain JCM 10179 / CIP 106290 / LMG 19151 / DSS12) TaxID=637905 RepID=D4ZG91_SHEVD|nr:helix-turn-helix domain-containing protein [Shewanella violacea]BAJ00690.1 hypothetical protein SVI_0719 [Shewanella violacea DSS12]
MQIGCCWFDIKQTRLSNQANDTSWKMPLVEFSVLELLVRFRDQVLSNEQLLQQLPEEQRTQVKLQQAVERVRFFMGEPSDRLLEAIDGEGFILHTRMKASLKKSLTGPSLSMSAKHYGILMAQLLLLLPLIYWMIDPSVTIKPSHKLEIMTTDGLIIYHPIYGSPEQKQEIEGQVQSFSELLSQCKKRPWDEMFYSVSKDKKIVNIILKNNKSSELESKNVKAFSEDSNFSFMDKAWLNRAGICELF